MNFIDHANITAVAGNGGDGHVSFRRERYVSKGGPDGGDGGDGGDVILKASNSTSSLATFRYSKQLKAESGQPGGNKRKQGKSGKDLIVAVPVGTEAKTPDGQVIADLTSVGEMVVIAFGGQGGFGNAHFVSSTRQAPTFAEKGEPGEEKPLILELKMLADIGLVGLPNAGKSTLLAAISNARPKVANYPFTTINPSVGVVDIDKNDSLLFADIPGLIEGAAEGKGLGHDFLRHIERTSVIVHVIDAYVDNIANAYTTIRTELAAYRKELAKRPEIIVINKVEGLDQEIIEDLMSNLRRVIKKKSTLILPISAKSGLGVRQLILFAKKAKDKADQAASKNEVEEIYEYSLGDTSRAWTVTRQVDGSFLIKGERIERFALKTDFRNDQAAARFMDILKKRGVMHELSRQGIVRGDKIVIGDKGELFY